MKATSNPSTFGPLHRIVRAPLAMVPRMRPVPVLSGPLRGARWLSTSGTHGCWLGTYERDLQRELWSALQPGAVFFDIGANVGFFSLLARRRVGDAGTVVAFEPLPRNMEMLRRNLALNRASVMPIDAAVSNQSGIGRFEQTESGSMGHLGTGDGIDVRLVTVDELVCSGEIPPPDIIKMDIEGAESKALAGARQILLRHRPRIFLSTHGWAEHARCCEFLRTLGYTPRLRRDGLADGQYEIVAVPHS